MPSTKGMCARVALGACFAALLILDSGEAAAQGEVPGCKPIIGRVVSRQGTVEIRRTGDSVWHRVERLDTHVCDGDAVRTGPRSRAALWLQPENLIRLDQRTAVTIAANQAETKVEFFSSGQVSADPDCGAAYFISRFPRNFGVKTPFLSAAVKGTEFLVSAQCSATTLAVFEGIVEAQELLSGRRFLVETLQQISMGPGLPSTIPIPIKPRDGVQWTIYYPRTSAVRRDAQEVVLEQCDPTVATGSCELGNAEKLLAAGAAKDASDALKGLRDKGYLGADLAALDAVIQIALDNREAAISLANSAVGSRPDSALAWTVLSYAKQARIDLEGALVAAHRASELDGSSALLASREAELLLALGRMEPAERAALRAVALDAHEPRARTMLGFVHLAKGDAGHALAEFRDAIELDSSDPLARLGAGLAAMKLGRVQSAREEMEIAVALDPTRAPLRTYLGRAYYEERTQQRDELAASQYGIAKSLDPNDPTPWLFDAARKQANNDPVGAARDLNESIRLNDYRAPVRSKGQLDEDLASRTAAVARTYRDLGFGELARQEAIRAFAGDQQNYSAHRLLAEAYADIPRQEVSRVSEVLQAQLRQPASATPLSAQLTEFGLQVPLGTDPLTGGLADYSGAFDRDRVAVQLTGFGGNLATRGSQWLLGGTTGPVSGSVTGYKFSTDGVREFNSIDKEIFDANFRISPTYGWTLQGGMTSLDSTYGDIPIRFDPANYSRVINTDKNVAEYLSLRYWGKENAETVLYLSAQDQRGGARFDTGDVLAVENSGGRVELQQSFRTGRFQVIGGAVYAQGRTFEDVFGLFTSEFKPFQASAYAYAYVPLFSEKLRVELGGSYDRLRARESGDQERFNPKIGVIWTPDDKTLVRAGYFEGIKRRVLVEQMLEPVNIAGFSQYSDDLNGARFRRRGIAASRWLSSSLNIGAEASERDLAVPTTNPDGSVDFDPQSERAANAYIYWFLGRHAALSTEYRVDQFRHSRIAPGSLDFSWLDQWQLPLSLRLFSGQEWSAFVTARYLHQKGEFKVAGTPDQFFEGEQRTWLCDAGVRWSFPGRHGFVSLNAINIFDTKFNYQETDLLRLRIPVRRTVMLRAVLEF